MSVKSLELQEKSYNSRKITANHQLPITTLRQEYLEVTTITVDNQTYLVDCYQTVYLAKNPYTIVGIYQPNTHTIDFLAPLPALN